MHVQLSVTSVAGLLLLVVVSVCGAEVKGMCTLCTVHCHITYTTYLQYPTLTLHSSLISLKLLHK